MESSSNENLLFTNLSRDSSFVQSVLSMEKKVRELYQEGKENVELRRQLEVLTEEKREL